MHHDTNMVSIIIIKTKAIYMAEDQKKGKRLKSKFSKCNVELSCLVHKAQLRTSHII